MTVALPPLAGEERGRHRDELPTKRMMETLRFWMMGWATDCELAAALGPARNRNRGQLAGSSSPDSINHRCAGDAASFCCLE